jgi:hypothetical protein
MGSNLNAGRIAAECTVQLCIFLSSSFQRLRRSAGRDTGTPASANI